MDVTDLGSHTRSWNVLPKAYELCLCLRAWSQERVLSTVGAMIDLHFRRGASDTGHRESNLEACPGGKGGCPLLSPSWRGWRARGKIPELFWIHS
jgi:hypothetical protein